MSNILNVAKTICLKIYNLSPFLCGIAIGYIFKTEVKWLLDTGLTLIKVLVKL